MIFVFIEAAEEWVNSVANLGFVDKNTVEVSNTNAVEEEDEIATDETFLRNIWDLETVDQQDDADLIEKVTKAAARIAIDKKRIMVNKLRPITGDSSSSSKLAFALLRFTP